MTAVGVRREKAALSSGCESHPANRQPAATESGRYWYHRQPQIAAAAVSDPRFQDQLAAKLAELTGVSLF